MTNKIRGTGGIALLVAALVGCATLNLDNNLKVQRGNYTMSQVAASRLRTASGLINGNNKIVNGSIIEGKYTPDSQEIYDRLCVIADIHPIDGNLSDEEAEKIFWIAYGYAENKEERK